MKITDFFASSHSFTNKGEERPVSTLLIDKAEQEEESVALGGMSGSIKIQTPRKKRERFTDPEVHKLVDTILVHIEQLFGSKVANAAGKAAIWDEVVREVNKVGGMKRTNVECKKRWQDYKRKVKQIIDNLKLESSLGCQMLTLSEMLSKRQKKVAEFFKMDTSDGQKSDVHGESSSDKGECVSTNENVSYVIDSEDEFNPSQNKSHSSSCLPSTSHQDKLISQSCEEPQAVSVPSDSHNTKAIDTSIPPHTTTESQLQLDTQMEQLIAQQNNMSKALQSIQKNLTTSVNIQNKMYNLMKTSFLALQKTLLSSQKASSDQNNILEMRLNSLHAKLDEVNSVLRVKQLQEIMYSDESELSASGLQDITSTPTATSTPATPHTLKKNSPARKRTLDQTPSPNLLKKKKKV